MATSTRIPSYQIQKYRAKRNQPVRADMAFVELPTGSPAKPYKRVYLGVAGTRDGAPDSWAKYDQCIGRWLANGRTWPLTDEEKQPQRDAVIVQDVVSRFLRWAKDQYGDKSTTYGDMKSALKPVLALFGQILATEFSPQKLVAVRDHLINDIRQRTGRAPSRLKINERIYTVRRAFRKAVEFELIGSGVVEALDCIEGLSQRASAVREKAKGRPVDLQMVEATKAILPRQIAAMIDLQLWTGARPSEILKLRPCDLDTSGTVWKARLDHHKTAHHGKDRTVYFGPKSQAILAGFMTGRPVDAYMFSPREAERERHAKASTHRRSAQRPNAKKTERKVGDFYTEAAYRRAIQRACDKAFPVPEGEDKQRWQDAHRWHPYQLRHTAATLLKQRGLSHTELQPFMGHSRESVITLDYLHDADAKAEQVALKAG